MRMAVLAESLERLPQYETSRYNSRWFGTYNLDRDDSDQK